MDWAATAISELWRHAWAVVPVAIGAVLLTRWLPLRPVTRHAVWVMVLVWFIAPLLLPKPPEDSLDRVSVLAEQAADQWAEVTKPVPQDHLYTVRPVELPPAPRRSVLASEAASSTERFPSVEVPAASAAPRVRSVRWTPPSLPLASGSSEPRKTLPLQPVGILDTCPLPLPDPEATVADALMPTPEAEPLVAGTSKEEPGRVSALALWLAAFRSVRLTLSQLPAMPAWLWLGGAALIAGWHLLGLVWFSMRMRKSRPAPRWVVREVRRVAQRCGLQRVPQVRMMDACISPLVLTGLRPRLYLPEHLWDQLDRVGRRAILCHELAHLRRGDDWVRWGELVISTICWWHPLVWWVRGRIHEEADLSCDTWVTWLMPEGRRAYAEALLRTKAFVSTGGGSMPAVGLGATSVGARKFARRLTMVMTKTNRPGNSWSGGVLLAGLMTIGWAGLPAFSCPPDSCEKQAPTAQPAKLLVTSAQPAPAVLPAAPAKPTTPRFFAQSPRAPKPATPRLFVATPPVAPRPTGLMLASGGDDEAQRVRALERQLHDMQKELRALSRNLNGQARPTPAPAPMTRSFFETEPESDELIIEQYKLSKGRLKALTELMIREDVPVLVRPMDGAIEVHATARHHRIFKAFVQMIEGREEKRDPFGTASSRQRLEQALAARAEAVERSHQHRHEAARRADHARRRFEELRHAQHELHAKMQAMEHEAHAMYEQAEALAHEADVVRDRAESADESDARKQLNRAAREIERKARALERKAEQIERQAEQLERKAEQMEEHADEHEHEHDEHGQHDADHEHETAWLQELGVIEDVEPLVAIALGQAADQIRGEAIPEVEQALRIAMEQVEAEAPMVADVLEPILVADESVITEVLEQVAGTLEEGVDTGVLVDQILESIEDVAEVRED